MKEIEKELGVCYIFASERSGSVEIHETAASEFSFSNANGPSIAVYCHDGIMGWDAENFAAQNWIRGEFQRGSISLFASNPTQNIYYDLTGSDDTKTYFHQPPEVWYKGEVALRHPTDFPGRNLCDVRFKSVRLSLDHLTEWMADPILEMANLTRKKMHEMNRLDPEVVPKLHTQLVTVTLRVFADRSKDDILFGTPIANTSTILAEIILDFKHEDGISYTEATQWVSLFQSLLSIGSKSPSNLKYFQATTIDDYAIEIYPKPNRLDEDIKCLKHKEVAKHLQDGRRFRGMFLDFKSLGTDGLVKFLEDITSKGHLDIDTLEYLAILANQHFTDYPRGFGHVELFRCAGRIAGENTDSNQNKDWVMNKVSQKARALFHDSDSSDNFNIMNQWVRRYRNNVAHSKEEPLPYDEADLTDYLRLVLSCHLLSDYADKSIWKRHISNLFDLSKRRAGTKEQV